MGHLTRNLALNVRDLETADELTAVVTLGPRPGIRLLPPPAPLPVPVPVARVVAGNGEGDDEEEEAEEGMRRRPAAVDEESAPP